MAKAEVIDLHEYFTQCPECTEFLWYIQWNQKCTEVMQIVCGNPECEYVLENPNFSDQEISFEPDWD